MMQAAISGSRTAAFLPFTLLLGLGLIGSFPAAGTAQGVMSLPNLNVTTTCEAARNLDDSNKSAYKTCMDEENNARRQVARVWDRARLSDRTICGNLAGLASPSYVELLTCLEMYNENLLTPASTGTPAPSSPTIAPSPSPTSTTPGGAPAGKM